MKIQITGFELFAEIFNLHKKRLIRDYPDMEIKPTEEMYDRFLNNENYFWEVSGKIYSIKESSEPQPVRGDSIWIDRDRFNKANRIRKIDIISNGEES